MAASLRRSSETFRRTGSSGSVWEDKYRSAASSGELDNKPAAAQTKRHHHQRSDSSGGYRPGRVQPVLDPPSPRVPACGLCSLFGKDRHQHGAGGRANATGGRRR